MNNLFCCVNFNFVSGRDQVLPYKIMMLYDRFGSNE
jgi:hypothetical protein